MSAVDFEARTIDGRTVLLVEAKSRPGMSKEWAAQLRRNYLSHFAISAPFLLATPDKFYWWFAASKDMKDVEPDLVTDARPILQPYLVDSEPSNLSPTGFESTVFLWLKELTVGLTRMDIDRYPDDLKKAGILESLEGAILT